MPRFAILERYTHPGAIHTPRICGPALGVEWHHDLLDRLFVKALREGAGLTEAE
jgi:hypothetical protein